MADGFSNSSTGGSLASDEITGFHYQKIKIVSGADNVATDISTANPLPVAIGPATAGGTSQFTRVSTASTNAVNVKATPGQLYGFNISNINAAVMYVTFYDTAGTPTPGTGVVRTIAVPGSVAGGVTNYSNPAGIAFASGIAIAITTGLTSGSVAANEVVVNLDYK